MNAPHDANELLRHLYCSKPAKPETVLADEDEAYLAKLLTGLRKGQRAVVIVDSAENNRLGFMFSNATRSEAVRMLGKVIEATGNRMTEDNG